MVAPTPILMQHIQVILLNENFRLTLGKNFKRFNVLFMFRYGFVSTSFVRYPHQCDEHLHNVSEAR